MFVFFLPFSQLPSGVIQNLSDPSFFACAVFCGFRLSTFEFVLFLFLCFVIENYKWFIHEDCVYSFTNSSSGYGDLIVI